MRYVVTVFDGKSEHIHKSIVANSAKEACDYVKDNLYVKQGKPIRKLWNAEALPMSR